VTIDGPRREKETAMRRIVPCVLLLGMVVPVGGAPAPLPKRPDRRPDWERLQGEWELVRTATRRGHSSRWKRGEVTLVIKGSSFSYRFRDDRKEIDVEAAPFTIAPMTKRLQLPYSESELCRVGGFLRDWTGSCAYRVQGGTLTLDFMDDAERTTRNGRHDDCIHTYERKKAQP
jgi:hypothetical protein